MKQTAVEFLADNFHYYYSTKWNDILEQAKGMEKQQIENAFEAGFVTQQWDKTKENKAEQYYNETFNK